MRSLAASLKGSFKGFSLIPPDTRKSSPTKLSPLKGSHHKLENEDDDEVNRSGILNDLESQQRMDSEMPLTVTEDCSRQNTTIEPVVPVYEQIRITI